MYFVSKNESCKYVVLGDLDNDGSLELGYENTNLTECYIKWGNGHSVEIDLFENSLRIGIEYDGYQHKKKRQAERDQTKNDLLHKYSDDIGIALFIRIREKGLPHLKYYVNQEQIICEKYRGNYKFLIPVIQQLVILINNRLQLNIKFVRIMFKNYK